MFRRMGPSDEQARLRRVMPLGSKAWLTNTDPAEGLLVRSCDLLLDSGTLQAFEEERDLLRRSASTIGASPRYDWDVMYAWLTWFLFEKGVPDTQTALVTLVHDWFVQNSKSGEVPDESTIRKRLRAASGCSRACSAAEDGSRVVGIHHQVRSGVGQRSLAGCCLSNSLRSQPVPTLSISISKFAGPASAIRASYAA